MVRRLRAEPRFVLLMLRGWHIMESDIDNTLCEDMGNIQTGDMCNWANMASGKAEFTTGGDPRFELDGNMLAPTTIVVKYFMWQTIL